MDNMSISSKFLTGLISRAIMKAVRKKLGYDIDIQLNQIQASVEDGTIRVHLDADAALPTDELVKMLG